MKKLIPKGQYGFPVINISPKEYLDKGSEVILNTIEPIGKILTKFVTAPQYGATSYATTGHYRTKEKAKEQALKEKVFAEKVGPALSPSNHIIAWTQGSMNPKIGQQKLAEWGPLAQLGSFVADAAAFKYVPKGVKTAGKNGKAYLISREINKATKKGVQTQEQLQPKVRTHYGDIEIDNPQLAYRQGNDIVQDFYKKGKVTLPEDPDYGKIEVKTDKGTFSFGKTFKEPMFAQGRLFFGLPRGSKGDLLVTSEPLALANKYSSRIESSVNGTIDSKYAGFDNGRIRSRRIQTHEGQLTPKNTTAYTWQPGYGYKKVTQEPSTVQWPTNTFQKFYNDQEPLSMMKPQTGLDKLLQDITKYDKEPINIKIKEDKPINNISRIPQSIQYILDHAHEAKPSAMVDDIVNSYNKLYNFLSSKPYIKRLENYYKNKGSMLLTQKTKPIYDIAYQTDNILKAKFQHVPIIDFNNLDLMGRYYPTNHSIIVRWTALDKTTPRHEMIHARNKGNIYLDNSKYRMRTKAEMDLNNPKSKMGLDEMWNKDYNNRYFGNVLEQEPRVLNTLIDMQDKGIDINNLTQKIVDNYFDRPIDQLPQDTQSLLINYNYDDILRALQNFKSFTPYGLTGYGAYKALNTDKKKKGGKLCLIPRKN